MASIERWGLACYLGSHFKLWWQLYLLVVGDLHKQILFLCQFFFWRSWIKLSHSSCPKKFILLICDWTRNKTCLFHEVQLLLFQLTKQSIFLLHSIETTHIVCFDLLTLLILLLYNRWGVVSLRWHTCDLALRRTSTKINGLLQIDWASSENS